MIVRNAEVEGVAGLDVQLDGEQIAAVGSALPRRAGEPVLDADGAALLPGLHDHHIHLFSLAAALESVRCGPPQVHSGQALERVLRLDLGPEGRLPSASDIAQLALSGPSMILLLACVRESGPFDPDRRRR